MSRTPAFVGALKMRAFRFLRCSLSLAAALALTAGSSSEAALLVYEGFDYPVDSHINGMSGGTGFAPGSTWFETQPDGGVIEIFDFIHSGSIVPPSWSNLAVTGNSVRSLGRLNPAEFTEVWRPLAPIDLTPDPGSTTKELWVSFVMGRASALSYNFAHYFNLVLSPEPSNNNVGALNIGDTEYDSAYMLVSGGAGFPRVSSTVEPDQSPGLLVVKMLLGEGNDRFELFVNPSGTPESLIPDAVLEGMDLPALNYIGFRSGATSRQWHFDEIRIGETYADVTPTAVPEPATALMGLVGAAVLGFRRRRS